MTSSALCRAASRAAYPAASPTAVSQRPLVSSHVTTGSLPCSMALVSGVFPSMLGSEKSTPYSSARAMHVSRSPPEAAQCAAEQPLWLSARIICEAAESRNEADRTCVASVGSDSREDASSPDG